MKFRDGFVSNSSSTSYVIKNISNEPKSLLDFANEVSYLVDEYNKKYKYSSHHTIEQFINSAENYIPNYRLIYDKNKTSLLPNEEAIWEFADESGCSIGIVLDYMLRPGGKTESFEWKVYSYNR